MRNALLEAAERLLETDGVRAVTLRAVARSAGVSHAAPKNHFDSLSGLLSELAAIGFGRLAANARAAMDLANGRPARLHALGCCYVRFALEHPGMFSLMFRSELLDDNSDSLRAASALLLDVLAKASGQTSTREISIGGAERMTLAWAQVHGLAVLLLEDRLQPVIDRVSGRPGKAEFVERLLKP